MVLPCIVALPELWQLVSCRPLARDLFLKHCPASLGLQEFWQLISSRALARNLFLKYCRAKVTKGYGHVCKN